MTKLKLLLKMLASFLALFFLFIAFVFFINRDDKEPSESVFKLQQIASINPPVADRDNAFVYVMGFSASSNANVMPEGLDRVEALRKQMEPPEPSAFEMPGEKLVQDNAQLIERYERLLEFKKWREIGPSAVFASNPGFNQVLNAQRLTYNKLLSPESKPDAADCRRFLEKDYRFWRMVLAESSSATAKMTAARSIEQHFELGNLVVRGYPPALTMSAIPDGWREPVSDRERSLAKVMANEWSSSETYADRAKLFGSFLYQPQATTNASAERMLRVAELFDRDYAEIPQAAHTFLASYGVEKKAAADIGVYNPVGRILLNMDGMDAYIAYGYRVVNLEGMRRLALLASQLRSAGVKGKVLAEEVRASELRDPYDGNEFAFDQAQNALLFHRTFEGQPDFKIAY
ncbi:hypothetical protein GM658_19250 [Pseudoduganella eburnea]|uniref:Uncharacterized protein n=1 Tax=Massilia eburnea TaxID=1776165 RepID=A0A6L6QJU2_9BURK|nr:hypothetical protein [Massilia eburnea]MTW12748.1 hypothetical protein [Massilia eburnea]